MQRIAQYLPSPADSTPELAAAMLGAAPTVAKYFADMSRSNKTRTRDRLLAAGYPPGVVDVLLPKLAAGGRRPPATVVDEGSPWALLPGPGRRAIMDRLGVDALPEAWTSDTASSAADALVAKYGHNPTSVTMALGKFRNVLKLLYAPADVPPAVRDATLRPEFTTEHNRLCAARLGERIAAGIEAPEPFHRIADLRTRVLAFIAGDTPPSGQTLADVLVTLAARPGEADRLELGERGAIKGITAGVLKKTAADGEAVYPVVSALGEGVAGQLLDAWRAVPQRVKTKVRIELTALCRGWGVQVRDLRAIGSSLAVRAAALTGDVENAGQARIIRRGALRHEEGPPNAVNHYERVNDPLAQLCARLAELSAVDIERIAAEVDKLTQ